jgi:hypothetical protein
MAIKVLTGEGYDLARLAGIMHEAWVMRIGRLVPPTDTLYGEGSITTNTLTGAIGLVCDTECEYHRLPEVHEGRLVDVVEGDGWNDVVEEG